MEAPSLRNPVAMSMPVNLIPGSSGNVARTVQFALASGAALSVFALRVVLCVTLVNVVWRRAGVARAVQGYRLVVLPVANAWTSWSLLRKLAWAPGGRTIGLLGALVAVFLALGVQVRGALLIASSMAWLGRPEHQSTADTSCWVLVCRAAAVPTTDAALVKMYEGFQIRVPNR